jgi:hypothetical protein
MQNEQKSFNWAELKKFDRSPSPPTTRKQKNYTTFTGLKYDRLH